MAVAPSSILVEYAQLVRRHWWIVLLVQAQALFLAIAWVETRPEAYEAQATVLVRSVSSANFFPQIPGNPGAFSRTLPAEAQFAAGSDVRSSAGLDGFVRSSSVRDVAATSVLEFRVTTASPSVSVDLASSWASEYVSARHEQDLASARGVVVTSEAAIAELQEREDVILEPIAPIDAALARTTLEPDEISRLTTQRLNLLQQLNDELSPIRSQILTLSSELARQEILIRFLEENDDLGARVLDLPTNARDTRPSLLLTAGAVGLLGVLLGVALALLYGILIDRISSRADLARLVPDTPVLGVLPQSRSVAQAARLDLATISSDRVYLESLQDVITSLQLLGQDAPIASISITSAEESAGKSTLAASISLVVAEDLQRVIAIDCDLRRSRLGAALGLDGGIGFSELIEGGTVRRDEVAATLVEAGESRETSRLALLPAGTPRLPPTQLLRLPHVRELIADLVEVSELVVIDGPPVIPVTDSILLAGSVDLVLVVVRLNRSRATDVRETIERVEASGTRAAVILIGGKKRKNAYYE